MAQKREEGQEGKAGKSNDGERDAFGPLDIKRYVKDDGRSLILYTLRERGQPT
jgi:hypothetical protein